VDFVTVPTLTFCLLYCFFVIAHDRRRILHYNVTRQPTAAWVIQQLREAFPYDSAPKYFIFERGTQFNNEVVNTVKSFGIEPKRTSFRSPWQNGVAERWVGNCRRDLLDHVTVLNERHLKRLMREYARYYHEDRTHISLAKETPVGREAATSTDAGCRVVSMPRLGACIIGTVWLHEAHLRLTSREMKMTDSRSVSADGMCSVLCFQVPSKPRSPDRKLRQSICILCSLRLRSGAFSAQMEFWRGTNV